MTSYETIYRDAHEKSYTESDGLVLPRTALNAGLGAVVVAAKAEALEEAAAHFQQVAVDQMGIIGFARVSLDLLHERAAEIRKATQ